MREMPALIFKLTDQSRCNALSNSRVTAPNDLTQLNASSV